MSVKCQNCGGEMSYDIRSKNLKCEYCKEKIPIEEYIEGKKSEVIENEDNNVLLENIAESGKLYFNAERYLFGVCG